jgi:hypothetical protein
LKEISAPAIEIKIKEIIYPYRPPDAPSSNAVGSASGPGLCLRNDAQGRFDP